MKVRFFVSMLVILMLLPTVASAFLPVELAPQLSYVTDGDIPNPTHDSTPEFTFSTSEGGILTMYGDCDTDDGAAVAGENTITLKELTAGVYSNCQITVMSLNGTHKTSAKLDIPEFEYVPLTLIPMKPVLTEVTAVPGSTFDQTPEYTFHSTLTGTIGYDGACSSSDVDAIADNNTIIFDELDYGTYSDCKVRVTTGLGGESDWLDVPTFTVKEMIMILPGSECAGYSDVEKTDSDCDAITYVQTLGAMTGNPNGTFEPDELLQRDQVAKISLETYGLFDGAASYCSAAPFPDVTSSAWSYQYVCRGVALGMITGYESGADMGYYRPARSVNRVEFLALILRNLSDQMPDNDSASYSDVDSGQWFSGYAKYSYDNSLFTGSKLYPTNFVSRREVAAVIYQLHQLGKI